MIVRKEDQKKLYILLAALVGVIGLIAFQLMKANAPTGADPSASKTVADQVGQASTANAARGVASAVNDRNAKEVAGAQNRGATGTTTDSTGKTVVRPPSGDIEVPVMYASNTGNPFRTIVPEAPPTRPTPPVTSSGGSGGGGGGVRPIDPGGPMNPPVMMLAPDIKVMGIVTGENEVAVVEVGGKSVVAHRGDQIAPMTTLVEIERFGIVIKFDKRLIKIPIL